MREIKFKVWDKILNCWSHNSMNWLYSEGTIRPDAGDRYVFVEFTGLKDKNGIVELCEGDIIDAEGNRKGNVYENDKKETDLVIEGMGTKTWRDTEQKALERGCLYA